MIYIVEDDASIRELEQYALQSNGYEVQGFESAEPFWQAIAHRQAGAGDLGRDAARRGWLFHPEKAAQHPFPAQVAYHYGHCKIQRAGHRARAGLRHG